MAKKKDSRTKVEFNEQARSNQPVVKTNRNDVEVAQDIAPPSPFLQRDEDRVDNETKTADDGRGLGIIAIILSALSFFLLPFLLAPAGIIVGVISARRGNTLGWWAIGVGIVALILMTLALPFRILF